MGFWRYTAYGVFVALTAYTWPSVSQCWHVFNVGLCALYSVDEICLALRDRSSATVTIVSQDKQPS